MLNIETTANGALRLSIADDETREFIADHIDEYSPAQMWAELLESYSTNGGYTWFDGGAANPAVGLTSAPCIAESLDLDDDGKATIQGRAWAYLHYMTNDETRILLERGAVEFDLIITGKPELSDLARGMMETAIEDAKWRAYDTGETFPDDADADNLTADAIQRANGIAQAFEDRAGHLFKFLFSQYVQGTEQKWDLRAIGSDFYMTFAGHGVGFWDRDLGVVGDRLTELAGNGEMHIAADTDGELSFDGYVKP